MNLNSDTIKDMFSRPWGGKSVIDNVNIKKCRDYYQHFMTKLILTLDFSHTKKYKIGLCEKNGFLGVLVDYESNGKWEWCWMNTLNTHYTGLFLMIKFLSEKKGKTFSYIDFSSMRIEKTLNILFDLITKHKQEILTPGSQVFEDLFFATQHTWNLGLISNMGSLRYIDEFYSIVPNSVDYNRGNIDDFCGVDYLVEDQEGKKLKVQHKKTNVKEHNTHLIVSIYYNDKNYDKLDLFTFEHDGHVFIVKNDKDFFHINDGKVTFNKVLLLHKIKKMEEDSFCDILKLINVKCCGEMKFAFSITKDDEIENNTYSIDRDKKILIITINDQNDPNLLPMLKEILYEL